MKIKVGGTYVTRNKRTVHIDFYTCIGVYVGRFIDNPNAKTTIRWDKNGRYDSVNGKPHARDIMKKLPLDFF